MQERLDAVLKDAAEHVFVATGTGLPRSAGRARSHLDDGRVVVWDPPLDPGICRAVDAERRRTPPSALARAPAVRGTDDFWVTWTRLEVIAKLLDQPVVTLLAKAPSTVPGLTTATFERGGVVITVGTLVPPSASGRSA